MTRRLPGALACAALLALASGAASADGKSGEPHGKGAKAAESSSKSEGASKSALDSPAESAYLTRAYVFIDAPPVEAYLRSVAKRLLDASGVKLAVPNILVYSSDAFDFFTDSKDNLVVSSGALRMLSGEDELAAVLGHELSHLILRHPHSKDALRAFPVGVETAGFVMAAADRAGGGRASTNSGSLTQFGESSLVKTQAVSLVWSDLLTPTWNRRQERAADERGFELMRAAGYDPSAFGTLFQRLHDAEAKRSKRMEILRQVMRQKAQQGAAAQRRTSGTTGASGMEAFAEGLKGTFTATAVDGLFEGLTRFSREYDSPDVRQQNLSKYAHDHRLQGTPRARPASRFAASLRQGAGATILDLDASALRTLDALAASDREKARTAVAPILAASPGGSPPSAHLNLAIGAWYQMSGRADLAEVRARAWLAARRPPANAYVWVAYYQALRRENGAAIQTLERGRRRVGASAPFLPHLVSLAKAAGQEGKAERYALECRDEDRRTSTNVISSFIRGPSVPSGLYADCVRRLGREPREAGGTGAVMQAFRHPVETSKGFAGKVKGFFSGDAESQASSTPKR